MLDAACPGQVFTSPTPDQMAAAAEAVEAGAGALFIVKNYAGDVMNFSLAAEMCSDKADSLVVDDDVALGKSAQGAGRRGVTGTLVVEKLLGAAAEEGADLAALKRLGSSVNGVTRSMGVATKSPASSCRRSSPTLARGAGSEVLLMINGFGATPLLELHLMYDAAARQLGERGLRASRSIVGNYVTSLDMAGCSVTVTLLNDELTKLWDAPVHTAALRWRM